MGVIFEQEHFDVAEIQREGLETSKALFEEIAPGLPPRLIDTRIRLFDSLENYPNPDFLADLYQISGWIDTQLQEGRFRLEQETPRILALKFSREDVIRQQLAYFASLLFAEARTKNQIGPGKIAFALPLNGSIPILDILAKRDLGKELLIPVNIWGTKGAETGKAEIAGGLPEKLLEPERMVMFADDVVDSAVTAIQLALARRKMRLSLLELEGDTEYDDLLPSLQNLLAQKKDHKDELVIQYQRAARLFKEEKVVIAPLYMKNKPLSDALNQLVTDDQLTSLSSLWGMLQQTALAVTTEIGEDEWIMGGSGDWKALLDTGVSGETLLKYIPEEHHKNLRALGFDRLSLRIGAGVADLLVFNPDGVDGAYDQLVSAIADLITEYMENAHDEKWYANLAESRQTALI